MGSSASKASRAAGAASRQYPTRPPPPPSQSQSQRPSNAPSQRPQPAPNHRPGPTVRPAPQASSGRSEAVELDARDPDFARSLRSLGPVQPNPTLSPTSTFSNSGSANPASQIQRVTPDPRSNPAIVLLENRARLEGEAEKEFLEGGRQGSAGRQFLDAWTLRQVLVQRDVHGKKNSDIEGGLGLREGVLERLGPSGVVGLVQESGRGRKEIDIV